MMLKIPFGAIVSLIKWIVELVYGKKTDDYDE